MTKDLYTSIDTVSRNKCVYLHIDSEGVVRYVGSGNLKRPYDKGHRSKAWNEIFSDSKCTVEIVEKNLTLEESDKLEKYYIEKYKETIVNKIQNLLKVEIDVDVLRHNFYIDATSPSGLRWKINNKTFNLKNKRNTGDVAGYLHSGKYNRGLYWKVRIGKKSMFCHRIIYSIVHGVIDSNLVIHHIDGNSLNNRIENLEQVTQSKNISKARRVVGQSGIIGINKTKCGYKARLLLMNGKIVEKAFNSSKLSDHEKLQKAIDALQELKIKYKGLFNE